MTPVLVAAALAEATAVLAPGATGVWPGYSAEVSELDQRLLDPANADPAITLSSSRPSHHARFKA
jgi:hypothetical protein